MAEIKAESVCTSKKQEKITTEDAAETKGKIVYTEKDKETLIIEAIENLRSNLYEDDFEKVQSQLWKTLLLLEDSTFYTAKGLDFYYKIKGNEIFFSRKEKSVTRASVNIALKKAIELQKSGIMIKGPKMLKSFGASYLYPVFIKIGVIDIGN